MWTTVKRVAQGGLALGVCVIGGNVVLRERARGEVRKREESQPRVAVVKMYGTIAPAMGQGGLSPSRTINLETLGPALDAAFKPKSVQAVVLRMNSPGGSPVQSSLLHKRLLQLREKYPEKPCVCFVEDVCASGGYYIAAACDKIFCDESSVVGSIGVIRADFKVKELAEKLGVERRVITAGRCKSQMDPCLDEAPRDRVMVKALMEKLHRNFIDAVRQGRGDRLLADKAKELHRSVLADLVASGEEIAEDYEGMGLFDGSVYVGDDAVTVGLVDGIDTLEAYVAREFGDDVKLQPYQQPKRSVWDLLSTLGLQTGSVLETSALGLNAEGLVRSAAELAIEHDLWARFGLSPPRS